MADLNILHVTDLILISSGLLNLILGFLVWTRGQKRRANIAYFIISVGVFTWVSNLVLFDSFRFGQVAAFWFAIAAYVGALCIPIASLYFATHFGTRTSNNKQILHAASLLFFVFAAITLIPGLVIESVNNTRGMATMTYGPLYVPYALYIGGIFAITFFYLRRRYYNAVSRIKKQLEYIFIGTIITASISLVTNLVLPYYGDFRFFMVGPTTVAIMAIFVGYAIIKHGLWDFRKIFTEVLIGLLVILSIANIIISRDYFSSLVIFWFKIVVVALTGWVAYILLNSFKKEQKSKKKLAKLNKKLKEFDEKKTEFLHVATHQLRGPVTAINGYAALMKDGDYGKISKEMKEPIVKILSAGKVMKDTINDYMNIARIEENRLNQVAADFDLSALVRERADVLQLSAKEKGIELNLDASLNKKHIVHADKQNLTQVMNALLENAIKYTKKGSVRVKMELTKDGKHIQVAVSDSGIGVAKKELDGLFDKFSRASNAKKANIFGTGMGLFIAKGLMKANGGSIKATSEGENKGTTFTIELPTVGA